MKKEPNILTIFCKRRKRSCVLVSSLEKNGKERNVLLGLISRQKLEKRTEKNGTFFFKNGKERNVPNRKERRAQPWLGGTVRATFAYNQIRTV